MAAGPVEPPRSEPKAERFGPLTLTRVSKDDGRALILYSEPREGESEDGRGGGETRSGGSREAQA
jgi:hypothetical protein